MSRIADAAANTALIQRMLLTQQDMRDANYQVSSGKKSRDYAGIALDSQRLVNLENARDLTDRFIANNQTMELRLNVSGDAIEAVRTTIIDFRRALSDLRSRGTFAQAEIEEVQKLAFQAMKEMEAYLNVEVDGQYLFSGSRVDQEPVDLGLSTLAAFQSKYDGSISSYATTRETHLADISITKDTNNENALFVDETHYLTFRQDDDGISSTPAVSSIEATSALFSDLTAGSRITVSGTASNNGDYTIRSVSNDGTKVYVETELLTDETVPTSLTTATGVGTAVFTLDDGTTQLTNADTGNIDFSGTAQTIEATTVGSFSGVSAGDVITISNAGANNGSYTVTAVDGTDSILTVSRNTDTTFTLHDGTERTTADTGNVTFDRANGTITAVSANAFSGAVAGETITVDGTTANDGTYTIESVSNDGRTVTVKTKSLTDEGVSSGDKFFDYTAGTQFVFNDTADTIQVQDVGGTALAGVFDDLQVGDSITIADSPSNDGTYTITAISSDGSTISVGTGALSATETDNDGTGITASARNFSFRAGNQIVFDAASDTIRLEDITTNAATQDVFDNLRAGMQIKVTGTAGSDGTYTIQSVSGNGSTLTVTNDITANETFDPSAAGTSVSFEVFAADGTISTSGSYYQGDTVALTHRVDKSRTVDVDVTAAHPAFEKAIRAMGLIAQGAFGSEGGLDQNRDRVSQAIFLLDDSLSAPSEGTPPFGTELESDLDEIQFNLGYKRVVVDDAIKKQTDFVSLMNDFVSDAEDADPLESITRLLDEQRSLQASYQAMSRVFSLSLADFLR